MNKDITKLVSRQLPLIDDVKVNSTWYALRMTPLGAYTFQTLEEFIKSITNTYIFTRELSKKEKEHYHCVINTEIYEDELREKIRVFLRNIFGIPKRGDANKQYNLSECIDVEQSIIYILKDGGETYYGTNIDQSKCDSFRKRSYKKFDSAEFADRLKEIKDKVKDSPNMKIVDIMERIVQLKAMYRQPINMNYIYQLSLSLYLHNHPDQAKDFIMATNYFLG